MWERRCVGCDEPGPTLCADCAGWSRPLLRPASPDFLTQTIALEPYDSGLGRAVTRCKGQPDRRLAKHLARTLRRRATSDLSMAAWLYTATWVSWIPSPWTRRAWRGFCLPAILATELSQATPAPCTRTLSMAPGGRQATAGRTGRARNLRGRIRSLDQGASGTIVLIDDVLTTGATSARCASELLGAGAARVILLTLCVADNAVNREPGDGVPHL